MGARCASRRGRIPAAISSRCASRGASWIRRASRSASCFRTAAWFTRAIPPTGRMPICIGTEIADRDNRSLTWRRTLDTTQYWARAGWTDGGSMRSVGPHEFRIEPAKGTSLVRSRRGLLGESAARHAHVRRCDTHRERDALGAVLDRRRHARPLGQYRSRVRRSSSGASCSPSISPRSSAPARVRRRRPVRRSTAGSARRTSRCTGGTPRTSRSGTGARCSSAACPWYSGILPMARATARRQGYRGARWPKMVGPDGRESPSGIGVFLIWQQPHPIYLAELVYRANPNRRVLEKYRRARLRVGRVHGVVSVLGSGGRALRARPAADPGAGEPPADDDVQPHLRARVLGVRSGDGAALARAARPRARAGVGPRHPVALADADARRTVRERGVRAARPSPMRISGAITRRCSARTASSRRVAWIARRCGARCVASFETWQWAGDLGMGLSARRDDRRASR